MFRYTDPVIIRPKQNNRREGEEGGEREKGTSKHSRHGSLKCQKHQPPKTQEKKAQPKSKKKKSQLNPIHEIPQFTPPAVSHGATSAARYGCFFVIKIANQISRAN